MWSPKDFINGTRSLTNAEKGVYIELINRMYLMDGPIEDDDRELAGCCKVHLRVYREIKSSLVEKGKLRQNGSKITANRVEDELNIARSVREDYRTRAQRAGKASGAARKNKALAEQQAELKRTYLSPSPSPSPSQDKKNGAANGGIQDLDAVLYQRGKAVLGANAGGQITKLKTEYGVGGALEMIETAAKKENPREYVAGALKPKPKLPKLRGPV